MNPKRILIIRPDHLGDLVLSLPVAEVLKELFPDCFIAYLAAPGPAAIGELVDYVDQWLVDSEEYKSSPLRLAPMLRKHKFDLAIELKPSWRTALAVRIAGIPQRIGTARRFYSFLYNRRVSVHRRGSGRHQADLDLALLRPFGIQESGRNPKLIVSDSHKLAARRLVGEGINRYIVIHPGSSGSAPNWPEAHYKKLAELIQTTSEFSVVITGLENFNAPDRCINLIGKTGSIGELAGVIAGAENFISGSTGPLHLADALGVSCLSFFIRRVDLGIGRWGPRQNLQNVLMPDRECSCRKLKRCRCLEAIPPETALEKLKSLWKVINS